MEPFIREYYCVNYHYFALRAQKAFEMSGFFFIWHKAVQQKQTLCGRLEVKLVACLSFCNVVFYFFLLRKIVFESHST